MTIDTIIKHHRKHQARHTQNAIALYHNRHMYKRDNVFRELLNKSIVSARQHKLYADYLEGCTHV